MLWAASCVGIFGFLRAGEFTVNSAFDPEFHLSARDLQVDCIMKPLCLKIRIKYSKDDLFHSGCDIYLGKSNPEICPLTAIGS